MHIQKLKMVRMICIVIFIVLAFVAMTMLNEATIKFSFSILVLAAVIAFVAYKADDKINEIEDKGSYNLPTDTGHHSGLRRSGR